MTADDAPRKFPRLILEVLIALLVLGLGWYGLSIASQQRPYLGEPAAALAQVPLRVLAAPNVPVIALFFASLAAVVTGVMWFVLRLIHQIFFRPVVARRVWREALFAAGYVIALAWLQINEVFSLLFAAALLAAFILLEVFLNIRERDE